jgi:hypothetical protein
LPPGLAMVGDKLDEVRLHLGGARSDIYALTPSLMSVTIDLSKAAASKQTFLLTEENIKLPRGIQLLDIAPSSVISNQAFQMGPLPFPAIQRK